MKTYKYKSFQYMDDLIHFSNTTPGLEIIAITDKHKFESEGYTMVYTIKTSNTAQIQGGYYKSELQLKTDLIKNLLEDNETLRKDILNYLNSTKTPLNK